MHANRESLFERLLFRFRVPVLGLLVILTIFFLYHAHDTELDSNLKKMVPLNHSYIQNFYKHRDELSLGNDIRIAVENRNGDIFDARFLEILRQVTEEAFYLPGVDKGNLKSLWTANVRWSEVDQSGIRGGEVIPVSYDGSPEAVEQVRQNVLKSDQIGYLVADNFRSAIVYIPLIDYLEDSSNRSQKHDYKLLNMQIETGIRDRFENEHIRIHVVGFGKKIGDLIEAGISIIAFFILTLIITFHLLVYEQRCVRSCAVIMTGAVMAVIWQLGIVSLMAKGMVIISGTEWWLAVIERYPSLEPIQFSIDPYSMLVPFLVFAIAVSHGVQYTNEMTAHPDATDNPLNASQATFRRLFVPGLLALLSDAIGFVTLWFIDIGVIRELAITASIGVAVIIITKLLFVPLVLSYIGVSQRAIDHQQRKIRNPRSLWIPFAALLNTRNAVLCLLVSALIAGVGLVIRQDLKIGDLDAGAPELHPDSRYNLDTAYIADHYSVSADVLVVMAETPPGTCTQYPALSEIDRFMWHVENVVGVESVSSVVTVSKHLSAGFNEGSLKWSYLSKIPEILNGTMIYLPSGFINVDCSLVPIFVFLRDHKAETLDRVVAAVENYRQDNPQPEVVDFVLASGNAGIEAATNQTIKAAEIRMLLLVYGVVSFMVWVSFRSWRAVICIVVPLIITSILCEALMTLMGIGIKVATLPVIALGVGIGVDYGVYIYAKLQERLRQGEALQDAYLHTLQITGRSVVFTGITLSISVGFWYFSAIKFQSDMGLLLTFMFLWNMVGALYLLPVLMRFLFAKEQVGTSDPKTTNTTG